MRGQWCNILLLQVPYHLLTLTEQPLLPIPFLVKVTYPFLPIIGVHSTLRRHIPVLECTGDALCRSVAVNVESVST